MVIGSNFEYGCLRSLRPDDADGMLEWMGDPGIAGVFQADFGSLGRDDVLSFIRRSWDDERSLHFAVSDRGGEYLGTVSLKAVDPVNSCAEYAIAMRSKAHGMGAAAEATRDVIAYAFGEMGLHRVYLNVRADNPRAIRFYDKIGFVREGIARDALPLRSVRRSRLVLGARRGGLVGAGSRCSRATLRDCPSRFVR